MKSESDKAENSDAVSILPPAAIPPAAEEYWPNEAKFNEAAPVESASIETPFCGELRSKRFFMLDTIPTAAEQYFDPSGHCWCYHTQQVIGPDDAHVTPHDCKPGRACYRSALADAT